LIHFYKRILGFPLSLPFLDLTPTPNIVLKRNKDVSCD